MNRTLIPNRVDEYAMTPEDFMNPDYIVPLLEDEQLHIGYTPLCEEDAFVNPISNMQHVFLDNFRVSREKMSLEQLISCIRKMMLYPTNNTDVYIDNYRDAQYDNLLYRTTCIVNDGEDYYSNLLVSVSADLEKNAYLVEMNRYSGDRNVFYRFYETFQYYIQTGGRHSPSIRVHCGKFYTF
jgi:hypothetical protein